MTFFGNYGMIVFRSVNHRRNIYWRESEKENVEGYLKGIDVLEAKGHKVIAVVCDNFSGLIKQIEARGILVQTCQWHVMKAIQRKTTLKPKTDAGKELLTISRLLTKLNKDTFEANWRIWEQRWTKYLDAKSINEETGLKTYTHEKLRAARRMINKALKNLFVYEDYGVFGIPRTNNGLEGIFSHLKGKIRIHRGLVKSRKLKLIDKILSRPST